MTEYLIITSRNLEDITLQELKENNIKILNKDYRKLKVESNNPQELLKLKSPDDIIIFLKEFEDTNHFTGNLDNIVKKIKELDLTNAIKICKQVREIKEPTFAVTASIIGKRQFRQDYLKFKVASVLKTKKLIHQEESKPEIDFHIIIFNNSINLGIRLTKNPLYKRYYKVKALKGSLKANIAYCMLRLGEVKPEEIVLDPFCGAGTIPIEAALLGAKTFGFDIDKEAIRLAKRNTGRAKTQVTYEIKDSRNTNLEPKSIDKIVSNLPFNKQIGIDSPRRFFTKVLQESDKILKSKGKMIFLTIHSRLIKDLLNETKSFKLINEREISLFGLKPVILIIQKN